MFKIISICKGGGYHYCRTDPPHPRRNSNNLYPLHRVIIENKIGRLLTENEVVHHKDGNKNNDVLFNLEIISRSEHTRHHNNDFAPPLASFDCPCGKNVSIKPHALRLRKSRNKSGKIFCSRSCGTKYS